MTSAFLRNDPTPPENQLRTVDPWKRRVQFGKPTIQRFEEPQKKVFYAPEWEFKNRRNEDKEYNPAKEYGMTPEKWEYQNNVVWPAGHIVPETGLPKAAEVFHCVENIHSSTRKMFYACQFAWRMNVDDAISQLKFKLGKTSLILASALEEAKSRAETEFYINNPSEMFVAECFAIQCRILKSYKRHARENWNKTRHRYVHLFVRLEEGVAPQHKRAVPIPHGWDKMRDYYAYLRSREVRYSI
uniref:Large ribosomal subunit protein uL22m n=1 Tax=Bursaphelenchus xylophilus TaxID=6326 RepID=A0A1I7SQL0_BURXY